MPFILHSMKKMPALKNAATASQKSAVLDLNAEEDIRDAVKRLKRERIISTAVELFYHNGLSQTTLEAVAEKMGVTKPFIYSHFKSKNELLAEICSRGIRASLDVLNRVVVLEASITQKVTVLAHDFMLAVLDNQGPIAIYNREQKSLLAQDNDALDAMRREFNARFCVLLSEGVSTGEFVIEDVNVTSLAIIGMISWSSVWYRANGRLTQAEAAEKTTHLVLAMIQAQVPGTAPSAALL
jgi:AcrR family transcriptional regulator